LAPYLTVESSRTEQSRVQDVCPVGGSNHNDTCTTHSTPHTMQTMVAQAVNMAVSQVIFPRCAAYTVAQPEAPRPAGGACANLPKGSCCQQKGHRAQR
jgi:hypothetical protein